MSFLFYVGLLGFLGVYSTLLFVIDTVLINEISFQNFSVFLFS